jgi:excisionase family DNA binding protein
MEVKFENLPQAVAQLHDRLGNIERLLLQSHTSESPTDREDLLTVPEAAKFLHLSVPTVYGLVSRGQLPVMKRSKRCYFSKTELLDYLKAGRKKTNAEIAEDAEAYLHKKAKKRFC